MIAYFFGIMPPSRSGHYCYIPRGPAPRGCLASPWGSPWDPLVEGGAYRELAAQTGVPQHLRDSKTEVEGVPHHYQRDGWTLIFWWDRSADKRHGSSSSFCFDALLTPEQAEAEARRLFPAVWARIDAHLGKVQR